MGWKDLLMDSYGAAFKAVEKALDGLTQEDLNWQPHPDCNTIGWITWHLTRSLDYIISSIMEEEQLWTKDGWYAKFNRSPDPNDHGYDNSPEQVAEFKCPDVETLLNYHQAVQKRSIHCLTTVSSSDISREIDDPWSQLFPTVRSRLVIALDEILQHAGQVCYIRGLLQGKGWLVWP
ncbi:DinB family protein [Chloroflexota bacterium]